jgi:CspA family cold shock protein
MREKEAALYTANAPHNTGVWTLNFADIVDARRRAMPNGTIKRLVRDRGFGFIRDDGGQEWFFHRSGVQGNFDQLAEGQRVAFDEESSPKGPRAGNVRPE